jgi:hypothetical protein
VNLTVNGAHPESLSALKSATGAWAIAIVEKTKSPMDIVAKLSFRDLTFKCTALISKLI